jgi:hypothetical protein
MMYLAPGSIRNWATAEDDEYIKQLYKDLHATLERQRKLLLRGLDAYQVGPGPMRGDLEDWNPRNPNFAIPKCLFALIMRRARAIKAWEEAQYWK